MAAKKELLQRNIRAINDQLSDMESKVDVCQAHGVIENAIGSFLGMERYRKYHKNFDHETKEEHKNFELIEAKFMELVDTFGKCECSKK